MRQDLRTGVRGRWLFTGAPALGAVLGLVSGGAAHDEDWRKLIDKTPPVFGEVWTRDMAPAGSDPQRGFNASGVQLLAQIPINQFPGSHVDANDCWGYVSASGREYAIIGLEAGWSVVEITDPLNPAILGLVPAPASLWHDVKVVGDYAYGVSDSVGQGVHIMDLSDVDNGNVRYVGASSAGGFSTAHNIVANPDSGRLFIVGGNVGNGGLVELDISNPESPQIAGSWTSFYVHDAQVVSYTEGPLAGREIAFCMSGLDGGWTSTGLRIVDVTDPGNFFTVATLFYSTPSYSHQGWLSPDKRYLYLNDELDEYNGLTPQTTTRIIDVSDLNNPFQAGTFTSGLSTIDHNLYTRDELIFESNYTSGLRIFNASNPLAPVQVGHIDTYPNNDGQSFNGAWSNYPQFPSGNVIISDINRGLFIVDVDALSPRLLVRLEGELPEFLGASGGTSASVRVEELGTSVVGGGVVMHILTSGGEVLVTGTEGASGVYAFTTPALDCGENVGVWFSAEASNGSVYSVPADAPASTYSLAVADSLATPFEDDFETDTGWSVSGSASDGHWNRGVPAGGGDRGDPAADFDGSGRCYLTDNTDGNSDVDNGSTTLTSPAMDATGGAAVLSYATWFSNVAGSGAGEDTMLVEISNDNGGSWQALETIGPGGIEAAGGWFEKSFDLGAVFASPSDQVRVRFTANDLGTGSVVEAGVDAVRVTVTACDPTPDCAPDLAEPFGSLDFSDVVAFLSAFGTMDPAADFAEPFGTFDFSDVVGFLSAFGAGCP